VRELGGCMGPIWKNYYKDAKSLMVRPIEEDEREISSLKRLTGS